MHAIELGGSNMGVFSIQLALFFFVQLFAYTLTAYCVSVPSSGKSPARSTREILRVDRKVTD